MTLFIDLQRRFRDLTTSELEEPELLASLNDREFGSPLGWPEILSDARVLLLGEAGSGKTIEMREQAKHLAAEGRFAFFVPLEALDRDALADIFSSEEEAAFDTWKADSGALAWFFLDAVDELKLTEGKLDRALLRFSKAVDGHLDRIRVIISCRPNDWRPVTDMTTFESRLPLLAQRPNATPPPDEIFLEALRRERGESAVASEKTGNGRAVAASIRTVILLPMSTRQIELFAQRSGLHDAAAFLAEIDRQNAWTFARRPLDLSELTGTWTTAGHLGTRAQQHEANIAAKLKDDPSRPDQGILTDAEARLGAEQLALALALTRTRTIRSPEQALDIQRPEGVLDPAAILRDWTERERQTLLRRALFDPATYGRVRFHHRSVQEFLAARHLLALREKGMSTKALFRLLFAECYAVEVVIPSMRPITAWLALWDDSVRRELVKREPEALLSLGDPESLSLPARAELVRAFVTAYHEGDWRGLDIPIDEVRRVTHPELAPTIRELWGNGPTNADVRDLLIEMIWKGPVEKCADLARAAALDVGWTDHQRIIAVRALLACGHDTATREIVTAILDDGPSWPDRIVYSVAADLFPKIMSVDQLVTLMERTREPQNTVGGFERASRRIAEILDARSDRAIALRGKIADLIWNGRNARQEFYRICGRLDHLTPALAILSERQLVAMSGEADAELIHSCVIASRFGSDENDPTDIVDLEMYHEAPPHDRDGLFEVMMDRLDDLAHDISQHDFTDRRTLRTISDETEMQRTLAWRIDTKKNGAFVVVREDEVADQKRTDIRLAAVRGDQKAVIEVKLADSRWSLTDLERALRNQLVGQYLRHESCKAGCLMLTYDGRKKYWTHPITRKRLHFDDMVEYLIEKARALAVEHRHDIRLAIFGLDLTDPVLVPAHRGSVR